MKIDNRPKTIVFDMDGTLVDVSSIRHHVMRPKNRNFDAFHRESVNCPPIKWVKNMAWDYHLQGYTVIQVTARSEKYRPHTSWWIADNNVPSDALYMRPDGDYRPDYDVKKDMLDRLLLKYDIISAYDDNPSIVALWSEYDIPCVVVPGYQTT